MSTIATQGYNKIIENLSKEEIELFNKNWLRKTKYPTPVQWHTEWYNNPMKQTFSLLHAPTIQEVKIQKKGEIVLDAMTFFDDETCERYTTLYKRNMMVYNSHQFNEFFSYIPGSDPYSKANNLGIMFLGGSLGQIPLVGVYDKLKQQWMYKDELAVLRLTKNQSQSANKKVLTCSPGYSDISNDCNKELFMPTLVQY